MICKHCGYEHGWSGEQLADVKGICGDSFKSPIPMSRGGFYHSETRDLFACPSCAKTFLDIRTKT